MEKECIITYIYTSCAQYINLIYIHYNCADTHTIVVVMRIDEDFLWVGFVHLIGKLLIRSLGLCTAGNINQNNH